MSTLDERTVPLVSASAIRGMVLVCRAGGRVSRVLRDDLGLTRGGTPAHLCELVDVDSLGKLDGFVHCLEQQRVAFDWPLVVRAGRSDVLHFAGEATGDSFLIVAAPTRHELLGLQPQGSLGCEAPVPHDEPDPERVMAELSEVNNELANLYRELARQRHELEASNARLRELDAWRARFVAVLCHELRNPLQVVVMCSELLLRCPCANGERARVEPLHRAALQVMDVLRDVLDLARLEAGAVEIELAPVDLGELAAEAVAGLRARAASRHLALTLEVPEPVVVTSDARRIRQVLLNLLGNALQYTEAGSVLVTVTREPDAALVCVHDTGPGVPVDRVSELFEPFSRLRGTPASLHEGTGLGLYLCRTLIDRLGGTIGIDTSSGVGAHFWFRLAVC